MIQEKDQEKVQGRAFLMLQLLCTVTAGVVIFTLGACTNREPVATLGATTNTGASVRKAAACSVNLLGTFAVNTDPQNTMDVADLPKGLYLATVSELYFEKVAVDGARARLVAQETAGSTEGQILCAENMDHLARPIGTDFDMAVTAPVKFDTLAKAEGTNFTLRQFYVFADKDGHGVVISNPEVRGAADKNAFDLKSFLNTGPTRGQIQRVSNESYVLRIERDQDDAKLRLMIRLQLFNPSI